MNDIGEAVGTAVEGGLVARAVNGAQDNGAMVERGRFAEGACLNCGTRLIGAHCHACGQKAHLHRTLGAFMHDLLHGALHFEGKVWRTLPELLVRPGRLTRRYIDGKRATYVSPMALFLFVIFLMFAVFQLAGLSNPSAVSELANVDRDKALAAQAELREVLDQRDELTAQERAIVDERLEEVAKALDDIENGRSYSYTRRDGRVTYTNLNVTGIAAIDQGIIAKWRSNPEMMLYKLQTNFYKFSWLLIPLSIPFVWLLFAWKRQFKAYDHAIFVTYSLSFMTLLILALALLTLAGLPGGWIAAASGLIPPIHIYKHLRGAYGLSRFSALWRLAVLLVFIFVVLLLFLQMLLMIGAF